MHTQKTLHLVGKEPTSPTPIPPHIFWPLVKLRVETGALIFPGFTANRFNLSLKALIADIRFDRAQEYSSKAFRRGATNEISETGSTLAAVITSGGWAAADYKSYLDMQMDEALNISSLLVEAADSDSDETDEEPKTTIDRLRQRWRRIPKEIPQKDTTQTPKKPVRPKKRGRRQAS